MEEGPVAAVDPTAQADDRKEQEAKHTGTADKHVEASDPGILGNTPTLPPCDRLAAPVAAPAADSPEGTANAMQLAPVKDATKDASASKTDPLTTGAAKQSRPHDAAQQVCRHFQDKGKCRWGSQCFFKHERAAPPPPKPKPPTLLQKLLAKDVMCGKMHLLQSFRFFVNNKFLAGPPEEPIVYFKGMEEVAADELDAMTTTPT